MKIAFGATTLSHALLSQQLDGSARYTADLGEALEQQGSHLRWVSFTGGANFPEKEHARFSAGYPQSVVLSGLLNLPTLGHSEATKGCAVFHATDMKIPLLKHIPVLATVHDVISIVQPQFTDRSLHHLKNWLFIKSLKSATHIVASSHHSARDLMHHVGISERRISVEYLGVNPKFHQRFSELDKSQTRMKLCLEKKFFLVLGSLQPRKNLQRTVQAFLTLSPEDRRETDLVIVGSAATNSTEELKFLDSLRPHPEVKWLGRIDDLALRHLMQSAIALVFPSLYEGFGYPVIEAFASGLPVITSNTTSLPELAGQAALTVTPTSAQSIADAMRHMLNDEALRQSLVQAGLHRIKLFDWADLSQRMQALYKTL